VDGGVVHEYYHHSVVIPSISPNYVKQLVDEVVKHGGVHSTFYKLYAQDFPLSNAR